MLETQSCKGMEGNGWRGNKFVRTGEPDRVGYFSVKAGGVRVRRWGRDPSARPDRTGQTSVTCCAYFVIANVL